jgi:hypothetical protein
MAKPLGHLARGAQHGLGERLEPGRPTLGLVGDGADVVVGDTEMAADLDVVGIFVGRAREIADLQDRHLPQPRIEHALAPDEISQSAEGAQAFGAVHQHAIEVDGARQQLLEFRLEVGLVEVGKSRHRERILILVMAGLVPAILSLAGGSVDGPMRHDHDEGCGSVCVYSDFFGLSSKRAGASGVNPPAWRASVS